MMTTGPQIGNSSCRSSAFLAKYTLRKQWQRQSPHRCGSVSSGQFDPEAFDIEAVNKQLLAVQ